MPLFSATTYVLFHFALDRDTVDGQLAAGVLWVTLLLAALLGISRLFVSDREEGGFDGFLLAPVDRTALFVAKALALFVFLSRCEVVAVPLFAILLLGPRRGRRLPRLLRRARAGRRRDRGRRRRSSRRSRCRPARAT